MATTTVPNIRFAPRDFQLTSYDDDKLVAEWKESSYIRDMKAFTFTQVLHFERSRLASEPNSEELLANSAIVNEMQAQFFEEQAEARALHAEIRSRGIKI